MVLIKLNFLRKSIITFVILLFSIIYIGCNQKQCWVCKGDGKNICTICEDRNNKDLDCIFCDNNRKTTCTFCSGKGMILKK